VSATVAAPPRTPGDTTPSIRAPRWALSAGTGATAFAGLLALAAAGVLRGTAGLVAAVLLTLAVPTSRLLSRRAMLAGALFFGLTPVLWWAHLPVGTVGRSGLVVAAIGGGLAAWLFADGAGSVRDRARLLVPRVGPVDAIPALAVAGAAWVTGPWLRIGSDERALAALLPGWDNAAHFDMARLVGRYGVMVDRLGPAPGNETWQFDDYPQGFHAVVATVMELLEGGPTGTVAAFARAEAVVLVLLAGMLAAAVCSLPRLRRRPAYALPLAALLVAAFVAGAGGTWTALGFPNYVLACGLAACVPLLVATMPRVAMPWHVAALGALLVGVANSWVMLLAAAAPAALPLLLPITRGRWRASRGAWVATGAVAAFTAVGLVAPLRLITAALDPQTVLTTPGGFSQPDLGLTVTLAAGAAAVLLLGSSRRAPAHAWHALAPVVALAVCGLLGLWQLRTAGEFSYYFYKMLGGVQLFSLAPLVLGLSRLVRPRSTPATARWSVGVLLATVAASQLMGYTALSRGAFTVRDEHIGTASALLAAAQVPSDASRTTFLASASQTHAISVQQWYLALTGGWTHEANAEATDLLGGAPPDLSTAVPALLTLRESALVVVEPGELDAARAAAGDAGSMVVSW